MLEVFTQLKQNLQVESRVAGVATRMDETPEQGGEGAGLTPQETLLAALTGCTAMTLRLYAQRKQWPLEGVSIRGTLERPAPGAADPATRIVQHVALEGPLDDEQRKRLMEIAGKCPVHRILQGPVALEERPA
jgi:putative redox protein